MDPVRAILRAGGVARWSDLQATGVSRRRLLGAVSAGEVTRPHRGCFALPSTRRELIDAAIFRGQPGCVSVLVAHGVPVLPAPRQTHVVVPDSRSVARPGIRPVERVVLHRCVHYPPHRMGEVPIALDLAARCLEPAAHLAAIEGAIRAERAAPDIIDRFRASSEERRSWLMSHLDLSAESPTETLARVAMREGGLRVEPQVVIEGVGRVDFLVEGRVIVECDGFAYHSGRDAFDRDRDRDRAAATRGLAVLRFSFAEVLRDPAQIVDDVRAVLWRIGGS